MDFVGQERGECTRSYSFYHIQGVFFFFRCYIGIITYALIFFLFVVNTLK